MQDIGSSTHSSRNQYRLSYISVFLRNFTSSRTECTGCSFSVNKNFHMGTFYLMNLFFSNVVCNIIDSGHSHIISTTREYFFKGLPYPVRHHLTVCPCIISTSSHSLQVALRFFGIDRCTCQLPIWNIDFIISISLIHFS